MRLFGRADDGALAEIVLAVDDVPVDEVLAELTRRWPPAGLEFLETAPRDTDAQPCEQRLSLGGATVAAWDRIESDLGLFAAERIAERVAVHAALAVVDGAAIVLPGRSFAGKTTLGLALAAAGATLASDEYALVDPVTGLVTGWPRPARVREGAQGSRREPVAPAIEPVPVALVAFLRFSAQHDGDDAVTLDAEPLSRADAVVAVLDETVCARSRPELALDAALRITQADLLRGVRGDAEAAAAWLLARLAERTTAVTGSVRA